MKKTIIYILILAIVIGVGIAIGLNMEDDKREVETASGEVKSQENKIENKVENKVENTIENNIENNQVENEVENVIEEKPQEEGPEDKTGEPKTDLEKAIDIVKEDWKGSSNVYFAQDGMTNSGEYIICVRDNNTTNALAWYKVNLADGTCQEW